MDADLRKVVKRKLKAWHNEVESQDNYNCNYDRIVFTNCRNVKPRNICIKTNPRSPDWQIGFFDTNSELYFNKIELNLSARFSSIVKNYWWNGKKGKEKKEGYYSLIKSVNELIIQEEHVIDLLNYVEGRYKSGEHWQIHELDRNIELIIKHGVYVQETVIEQLSNYFDNIWYRYTITNIKTENKIICNCNLYTFNNCEGIMLQKLVINAIVKHIRFDDADNEVHIPEIVMEERADFRSIIQNEYRDNEYGQDNYYSLLPYVQTLVIRNNPKVLYDLTDYINGKYTIDYDDDNYSDLQLYELNKNIKIVIEKPGIVFDTVKEIANYFADVLVDNCQFEDQLTKQQSYYKLFQEHFDRYALETDQIENFTIAGQELDLKGRKFNVGGSSRKINRLYVNQEVAPQQFICFHDTNKPVVINEILIDDGGDLRCVLQNTYYNGTDVGFFSLLRTAKELKIYRCLHGNYQALADLADYIEGKYALNANWKQEELNKDMRIKIDNCRYDQLLSVIQRLRKYFKNVSIDRIYMPLETQNVIDQECEEKWVFVDSRKANPQKLVINAKLMGSFDLIQFDDADGEVHIPEITIDEQGDFAAIVRNNWYNIRQNNGDRSDRYSLVQHVKTLTIRNNPDVLKDLADYLVGKYKIDIYRWKLQQLNRNIKVVIEGPGDAFLLIVKIFNYFQSITIDGEQANDYIQTIEQEGSKSQDYRVFKTYFDVYGLLVYPLQYGVEAQNEQELVDNIYNIRESMDSIYSLTVRQKLGINQFVCFHDIDKPATVDKIIIDDGGDLRSVLQNTYYSKGRGGFFSLLNTTKRLDIHNNQQAVEDLANYVNGKYAIYPKWATYVLDEDVQIKINIIKSSDVAKRLINYFKNISINCIQTPLETENVIGQECKDYYIFGNCRETNPQKLVVNAKITGDWSLMLFYDADDEVYIPKITIGEYGSFDAVVRNQWQNCKNGNEEKHGYYSLVSHVETLTIQNNPEAVRDLDSYISGKYWISNCYSNVKKLSKNTTIRINGIKGLDEQINRLGDYFRYIFVDGRKALGNSRQQMLTHINAKSNNIRQRQVQNKQKQQNIDNSVTSIQDTKRRIERARARLGRRRARFQEYLALIE